MTLDVVCKMQVDPQTAAAKTEYKGKTYYFCSPGCKADFEKDPERYLKADPASGQHGHMH
jgi:Cu+-exporting ATPase